MLFARTWAEPGFAFDDYRVQIDFISRVWL